MRLRGGKRFAKCEAVCVTRERAWLAGNELFYFLHWKKQRIRVACQVAKVIVLVEIDGVFVDGIDNHCHGRDGAAVTPSPVQRISQ